MDYTNSTSVVFIDFILEQFQNTSVQELFIKDSKIIKVLKTFNSNHTELDIDDPDMLDVFARQSYNYMSYSKVGKMQFILNKYNKPEYKIHIGEPDNNSDEYTQINKKLEKAKAKYEIYKDEDITLEDCMTDTTGDFELYLEVTQRKYDLFMAWSILKLMSDLPNNIEKIINYTGIDYTGDESNETILNLIKNCYLYIGNEEYE